MFTNLSICQHSAEKRDRIGTRDAQFLKCSKMPADIPVKQKQKINRVRRDFYHTHINTEQIPGINNLKHLHKD